MVRKQVILVAAVAAASATAAAMRTVSSVETRSAAPRSMLGVLPGSAGFPGANALI